MDIVSLLLTDFYKIGHVEQYAPYTRVVYSNWTPRNFKHFSIKDIDKCVVFGLQYFIKEYLINHFNKNFFNRPKKEVIEEYREVIKKSLGKEFPNTSHIEKLHDLGYLPIKIYALPEGSKTKSNIPHFVVHNTKEEYFWIVNFFETILSTTIWGMSNSATIAHYFKKLFRKYNDTDFVNLQGHDFSMRGMLGLEAAILSGMGHLTSFSGTDTIPAIVAMNKYYNADLSCGGSVDATEHSVACSYTSGDEYEYYRRLIQDIYPNGFLSLVSDTYDLWEVATKILLGGSLYNSIVNRDGRIIIRPDSGDPVKIICGDDSYADVVDHKYDKSKLPAGGKHPAYYGLARILAHNFGVNSYGVINHVGMIYGDSINYERAEAILEGLKSMGLSSSNIVFGLGSYLYQHNTRDSLGFAMKATAIFDGVVIIPLFKDPITDSGLKKSHKGIVTVHKDGDNEFYYKQECAPEELDNCEFQLVFEDSRLLIDYTLAEIRERLDNE